MATPSASLYLWHGQGLYIGAGQFSTRHRHYATQIGVSLDGNPIRIRTQASAPYTLVSGFIAPPNVSHQVDSAGVLSAFLWTESEQVRMRIVRERTDTSTPLLLSEDRLQALIPRLALLAAQPPDCVQASEACAAIVQALAPEEGERPTLNPRILSMLKIVRQDQFAADARPIPRIAEAMHLSTSQLRHMFRSQLGLPLQRYLLWQRLLRAVELAVATGMSLTHVGHAAGFADSAHLARVFRATFGLKPSDILQQQLSVQVVSCLDPA